MLKDNKRLPKIARYIWHKILLFFWFMFMKASWRTKEISLHYFILNRGKNNKTVTTTF